MPDLFNVWSQPTLVQNQGQKSSTTGGGRGMVGVGVVGSGTEDGVALTVADKRMGAGSLKGVVAGEIGGITVDLAAKARITFSPKMAR